jgi:ATP-dependent DNA helicase RecG
MPEDEITLITAGGIALRTAVDNVRAAGRATLGVRVISLDDGDRLASLARLEANPEENARAMAEAATQTGAGVESKTRQIEDEMADEDVEDTKRPLPRQLNDHHNVLKAGPSQLVEYLPDLDVDALAETLVAFANGDGGTIIVGLDERGKPTGRVYPEDVESALRRAEVLCRPPIHTGWEQVDLAGSSLIAVSVARSAELHSVADGRVVIRMGADNRPLAGDAIRQLAATKSSGEFETEVVPGARRADLDDEVIAEYLAKREERQRRRVTAAPDELLQEIGALDARSQPTVAGMLLFGRNPQQFLPQTGLVFVSSSARSRVVRGLPGYGRREEITGPLARVIEGAWEVIWEEMHVGAVVKGLEREERTEYPPFAVRECLVNAVCHRDYRLKGRRIEIRMFADRLEVISPGGLPGFITVDNLVEEHFSRNPRLVAGLFQWGYIEELGLGIDRMIEEMTQAGHRPPQFKPRRTRLRVVVQRQGTAGDAAVEKAMNEAGTRPDVFARAGADHQSRVPAAVPRCFSRDTAPRSGRSGRSRGCHAHWRKKGNLLYSQVRCTRDVNPFRAASSGRRVIGNGGGLFYLDHARDPAARWSEWPLRTLILYLALSVAERGLTLTLWLGLRSMYRRWGAWLPIY